MELTQEQEEQLLKCAELITEAWELIVEAMREVLERVLEMIKKIAINLARVFMKAQLLKWKIPVRVADYLARKAYWRWACCIGYNWPRSKSVL